MSIRVPSLGAGILGGVLAVAPSTHASSWTEVGDAGSLPATAQIPTGTGALDTIVGTINFGDVDVYEIRLTGGGTFSAAAVGAPPLFLDPQLYLFDSAGRGVYANDDTFPPDPFFPPGRAVLPAGNPLTPVAPGIYFLAISSRDLEPVSSGGFIFPCVTCTPGLVAGPSGPGGGLPITGWSGSPFTTGSYTITLTGAEFRAAQDLFVDPGGTCGGRTPCFSRIQAAIDTAAAGDRVLVGRGTYVENIDFHGKAIIVVAPEGPGVTIIDGNQAGSAATFAGGEGPSSVLVGFTLRNGRNDVDGGGINIQSSSPTILANLITRNACANGGGGIASDFGSPLIVWNWIANNSHFGSGGIGGGGISVGGASHPAIIANVIVGNSAEDGGGISLFTAGNPLIADNFVGGNTASHDGGGISMANISDADVIQNLIVFNRAARGGGVAALVPAGARGPLLVSNTVVSNDGPLGGSGAFIDGFDDRTVLVNNIVVGAAGQAAVFCGNFTSSAPVFSFNDVFRPDGPGYGGMCADETGINANISADPMFVNPAMLDYDLRAGSPAIDVGDNAAPMPMTDLHGHPRIVNGTVDMGAYEFQAPGAGSASDSPGRRSSSEALRLLDRSRAVYEQAMRGTEAAHP